MVQALPALPPPPYPVDRLTLSTYHKRIHLLAVTDVSLGRHRDMDIITRLYNPQGKATRELNDTISKAGARLTVEPGRVWLVDGGFDPVEQKVRPSAAGTGFYVDATGSVLTSAGLVGACGRITIDEAHEARVAHVDADLGFALLRPAQPLAPLAFANFHLTDPAPRSEVRVAGFSFEDLLTRPTLAIGQLAALQGLNGEAELRRLSVAAMPGDAGGPVFDATGSVIGMLLPAPSGGARLLPDDVHLAVAGAALHDRLQDEGITPATLPRAEAMPDEELMRAAADMTVLVSCWN